MYCNLHFKDLEMFELHSPHGIDSIDSLRDIYIIFKGICKWI